MNILLVDDDKQENDNWEEYLRTQGQNLSQQYNIRILHAEDLDAAERLIKDNQIDFLVLDIRLGIHGEPDGNELVNTIKKYGLRIPTVFYTGNSDDITEDYYILQKYKKSIDTVEDILLFIISIWNTGINDILNRNGFLEKNISKFYKEIFIPNINQWIKRQEKDKKRVRRALMKIALNNLNALLEYDEDKAYGEQVYLFFIDTANYYTGSLLQNKETQEYYIVISPSCDIFLRKDKQGNDQRNVDIVHLLKILKTPPKMKMSNEKDYRSNKINRYHFLPVVSNFNGGFVDFADITLVTENNLNDKYEIMKLRISEPFMKNISGRFSSYFGRQGQPDLDFEE